MVDDSPTLTTASRYQPASTRWLNPKVLSASVSAHLDVIRSVAAWAVMWGHLRALFFIDYQELSFRSPLLKAVYFVTGFGHEAVMVFFVLSGFLISSSILRSQASGTWSWAGYVISRCTRLYVVLIPGLLFGALWDFTGKSLFAASHLYSSPLASFAGLIAQKELNVKNFLGNLLFLQTIFCKTFGSNGPLWSIANEFWYYVLFPLGLAATLAWKRKRFGTAAAVTLLALIIIWMLGTAKMIGFGIWLAGFVVLLVWSRMQPLLGGWRFACLLASGAVLATSLYLARTMRVDLSASEVAIGVAFAAFLFGVLQLDLQLHRSALYLRGARLFAGFSYSLYVLHFPLLLFLRAWLSPRERWQPDAAHLIYGLAIGFIALLFSWLVALGTEYQTGAARNALSEFLGVRKALRAGHP